MYINVNIKILVTPEQNFRVLHNFTWQVLIWQVGVAHKPPVGDSWSWE